jgi:hypothetical protein
MEYALIVIIPESVYGHPNKPRELLDGQIILIQCPVAHFLFLPFLNLIFGGKSNLSGGSRQRGRSLKKGTKKPSKISLNRV